MKVTRATRTPVPSRTWRERRANGNGGGTTPGRVTIPLMTLGPWAEEAACRDATVEFFRPEGEGKVKARERETEAKKICASCSVAVECFDYALSSGQLYGVWGGIAMEDLRRDDELGS